MEHTVEKLSGNKVKISFKAPAADFEEAVEKAYLKMRGQISVPGFRKGKAPRKLIERMYGAGGTAEHQTLVIGSGNFIPGFEEQMVGMTIGEERDLHVTFPEQYHAEDLKGKDAVFHVKLHAITREELPDVDDEFAAEVSDFDTLAEYRADLEKKMQEAADAQAEEAARQTLVDSVVRAAECDVPAPMVEEKLDDMMQQMGWRMQQQGFSMEQYLKLIGQPIQRVMQDVERSRIHI